MKEITCVCYTKKETCNVLYVSEKIRNKKKPLMTSAESQKKWYKAQMGLG